MASKTGARTGPRPVRYGRQLVVMVTDDADAEVRERAQVEQTTVAAILRKALDEYLTRQARKTVRAQRAA